MIARLGRNPYVVALLIIAIVGAFATAWSMAALVDEQGFGFSQGELWRARLWLLLQGIPVPATITAVAALLAVLLIGSATSELERANADRDVQRATRTRSADGSTRNRAATSVPKSSPSISNSSESPSISMSTERPRE
jgi:hypothetical protein